MVDSTDKQLVPVLFQRLPGNGSSDTDGYFTDDGLPSGESTNFVKYLNCMTCFSAALN